MKVLFKTFLTLLILTSTIFATPIPRQKISLLGKIKGKNPVVLSLVELEKLTTMQKLTIHDPYNNNIKTTFNGFYLEEIIKRYADVGVTKIKVKAIDGYQIDITTADISREQLFFSFKDEKGFLSVDRMGPARIIAFFDGVISKDLLLKLGVNWVWKVKSIEFM